MPVFHTKTIESILEPVASQVTFIFLLFPFEGCISLEELYSLQMTLMWVHSGKPSLKWFREKESSESWQLFLAVKQQ